MGKCVLKGTICVIAQVSVLLDFTAQIGTYYTQIYICPMLNRFIFVKLIIVRYCIK